MFYAIFLTVVIILLAIGFLFSGFIVLYRQRRSSQPRQVYGIPRRGMKFTPILVIVMPAILVFAWVATASFASPPTTQNPTIQSSTTTSTSATTTLPNSALIAHGTLTVGVSDSSFVFPPETYYDKNKPAGFDIDLITEIAKAMHLSPKIQPAPWKELIPGLDPKNKKFDVVIFANSATNNTLSVPYLAPKDVLLVPNRNPDNLKFDALTDLCGHTIGVQDMTSELDALNGVDCKAKKITPVTKPDVNAVADLLLQNKVDAIYQSTPTMSYYLKKYQDKFQQVGTKVPLPQEGILIRQDNQIMQTAIQNALNTLIQNGKYADLLKSPMGDLSEDTIATPTPTAVPPK